MTVISLLRHEFVLMRHHVTGITKGLTKDELIWAPPGVANVIGKTFLHRDDFKSLFGEEFTKGSQDQAASVPDTQIDLYLQFFGVRRHFHVSVA